MGKKGASSWLTAVKRAFRSPSKDSEKKPVGGTTRLREELERDEEEKREKRRWLFRKSSGHDHQQPPPPPPPPLAQQQQAEAEAASPAAMLEATTTAEQRHAIAVAVATAAAAEAAMATAHAVVEVARLAQPPPSFVRAHFAAVAIQTAFRGFLARRALRALKGLVKLQALVRGHNVRKQANMTLRCMEALVRAQARVRDQRVRLSQESYSSKASFSCDASLWEPTYLHEPVPAERRSLVCIWHPVRCIVSSKCFHQLRDGSYVADDPPQSIDEIKATIHDRMEAAMKREKALAYALSQQLWRSRRNLSSTSISIVEEQGDGTVCGEDGQGHSAWLDRFTPSRASWDHGCSNRDRRASTDQRDPIKTLEMDTARPSTCANPTTNYQKLQQLQAQAHHLAQHSSSSLQYFSSSYNQHYPHNYSPIATPSPVRTRPLQVRSASPRCGREEKASLSSAYTPRPSSYYYHHQPGDCATGPRHHHHTAATAVPNYMAATESAKAKLRSQSTPRQRLGAPPAERERERPAGSAKKRLSFPVPNPLYGDGGGGYLRSPSFKSAHGRLRAEHTSTMSSCTESLQGEVSPSSTTDLRRWLRSMK
ncbi:hypothetical protein Taro_034684 [Colocasia esculenta]|uniref:DUF4005 domain-containing protein n=1 Tax=Colocasia esculenta TaxID=4460 RepID=A0A843W8B0_COLES|nr:hypothetical protein [Colocasia esculenta]